MVLYEKIELLAFNSVSHLLQGIYNTHTPAVGGNPMQTILHLPATSSRDASSGLVQFMNPE